ncbi:MAG TPA: hypothetical protein PLS70_08460, partial [Acidobacteriota bacterium]|nr:hypothetical protein [Acidobacteriota bacterium]
FSPKPDVFSPKPDVFSPKPDVFSPKPDVFSPSFFISYLLSPLSFLKTGNLTAIFVSSLV